MSTSIRELLNKGFEFLGTRDNALLECELILGNVLGVEKEYLISHSDEQIGGESFFGQDLIDLFWQYLKLVKAGEPVAYILKEKEFYGLNFYVDNRVLVPRPETELLVETVLSYIDGTHEFAGNTGKIRVLDVGAGSANIAIALAVKSQNLELIAVDISEVALEVARINLEQFGMEDRVQLCQSDLLEVVDDGENFDVIVTNLPYIGTETNSDVEKNVKKYEPAAALFAGSDGLLLYKKMFQQIRDKNIGFEIIVGEFGSMQRKDMEELLDDFFEQRWRIEKDLTGLPRMFVVSSLMNH